MDLDEFRRIKASLKQIFDGTIFRGSRIWDLILIIEGEELLLFFEDDKDCDYLVTLINEKQLEEFIWLNTLYNTYL